MRDDGFTRRATDRLGRGVTLAESTADDNQIHRIARNAGGHAPALVPEMVALPRYRHLYSAIPAA